MQINYLGPKGSYSHLVAIDNFPQAAHVGYENFDQIIEQTLNHFESIGILPLENSISSNVHENFDKLFNSNLNIIGEYFLKIELNLIGLSESSFDQIDTVISHPKALAQCHKFIEAHKFKAQEAISTSQACEIVIQNGDKKLACLGGAQLKRPGLTILQANIGDHKENYTRFVLISTRAKACQKAQCKMTIICTLKHEKGSLANLLVMIAKCNGNLTKIESRPIAKNPWEYQFWLDIVASQKDLVKIQTAFETHANQHKIVGIY